MTVIDGALNLGRWGQIRVLVHWSFFIYFLYAVQRWGGIVTGTVMVLLTFAIVLLHEFGHCLGCKAVGGYADRILLQPLGGLAFAHPPNKVWPTFVTVVCGPLVNVILVPLFWAVQRYGMPHLFEAFPEHTEAIITILSYLIQIAWVNRIMIYFNLLPIYPLDGGRLLQTLIWSFAGHRNSLHITGMVGTVGGGALLVLGTGLYPVKVGELEFGPGVNIFLIAIGVMALMASFGIYQRSQEISGWRKR